MWIHRGCLCLCAGLLAGCENPHPSLSGVNPNLAYSGQSVSLAILGDNFVPAMILDPEQGRRIVTSDGFQVRIGSGNTWWQLSDVAWLSTGELTGWFSCDAVVDPGGPPLRFDVELVDPRGRRAVLDSAFTQLGPDVDPPQVSFASPSSDAVLAPGMLVHGLIHAKDVRPGKLGTLSWSYLENGVEVAQSDDSCVVLPGADQADCSFQVEITDSLHEGDSVLFVALATDDVGNPKTTQLAFTVHAKPSVTSISPTGGGTAGGTDVVIRGTGFTRDSTATIDGVLLSPNGGIFVDATTLSGYVPPHAIGSAAVVVHTPMGNSTGAVLFEYQPPPQITSIVVSPESATCRVPVVVNGTGFTGQTDIDFGDTLASAVVLAGQSLLKNGSIVGCAPGGFLMYPTVWAFDPDLGYTQFAWGMP